MNRIYYMIEDKSFSKMHILYRDGVFSRSAYIFGFGGILSNDSVRYNALVTYSDCNLLVIF